MKSQKCPNCGATLKNEGSFLKCPYCNSVFDNAPLPTQQKHTNTDSATDTSTIPPRPHIDFVVIIVILIFGNFLSIPAIIIYSSIISSKQKEWDKKYGDHNQY